MDNKGNKMVCLDELLCFTTYATNNLINRLYIPYLKKTGLTYPQYLVLVTLREHGMLQVGAIGQKLFLESNTLTPLLKRMETQNLITRQRSKEDERQVTVSVTALGLEKCEQAFCMHHALLEGAGMTLEELGDLNEKMKKLQNCLREFQDKPSKNG